MTIVVIGLGSMGKRRIRLIQKLYPTYTLYGLDNKEERRSVVEKEYQIQCFSSLENIPKDKVIDCAFICTAPLAHGNLITECLHRGYHIFTEINLINTHYKKNIELAKEKELVLFLSSTPIYKSEMRKIQEIICKKKMQVNYSYHVGQYLPDWHPWEKISDFFVGDKKTNGCRELLAIELPWMSKVFGQIRKVEAKSSKLTKLEIDYDDNYMIYIEHENGTRGIFIVDIICRQPVRTLEIFNEELYLRWNGTPKTLEMKNLDSNQMKQIIIDDNYSNEKGYSEFINEYAYINEIKEFFQVLVYNKTMEYSFEEDEKILEIIDEIEGNVL